MVHGFDNRIMMFENLIDKQRVSFLDTMSIIPIHMPGTTKLDGKSLGKIYKKIFGRGFDAHRAMSDVDALIEIMRYLGIQF